MSQSCAISENSKAGSSLYISPELTIVSMIESKDQPEQEAESKLDRAEEVPARAGKPSRSDQPPATDSEPEPSRDVSEKAVNSANEDADGVGDEATARARRSPVAQAAGGPPEDPDTPFTPSPFVTGRTRSRLSRCSARSALLCVL